jgi:hypothetical protein
MSFTLAFVLKNPEQQADRLTPLDLLEGPERSQFVHMVSRVAQGLYLDSPSGWRPLVLHRSRLRNPRAAEWLPLLDDAA